MELELHWTHAIFSQLYLLYKNNYIGPPMGWEYDPIFRMYFFVSYKYM
jgi:hypothetical protein